MFRCHQTWRAGNPPLIVDVPLATKHVLQRKTSFLGLIQSAMFAATREFYLIYPNNQPFQAPWLSCLWCLGRLSGKRQVTSLLLRDLCIYFSLYIYIYTYVHIRTYIYIYDYIHMYVYIYILHCLYTAYFYTQLNFQRVKHFCPICTLARFSGCLCIEQKTTRSGLLSKQLPSGKLT